MKRCNGFSLMEVLVAFALSMLLLGSLLWLAQDIIAMSTWLQQQRLLLQRSWILDHMLRNIFEHAGDSAIYASPDWQALTHYPALRLYQVGVDPLPSVLPAHWHNKLLAGSTIIESQTLATPALAHQPQGNQISLSGDVTAKTHSPWLLVSPTAWQLVHVLRLNHHDTTSTLIFDQNIDAALQYPYLVGRYQHHLWFVAFNGHREPSGEQQYGLYQWDVTDDSNPQEIVSSVLQWHGDIVAQQAPTPLTPTLTLIHWHLQLQAGHQSRRQQSYYLNRHRL